MTEGGFVLDNHIDIPKKNPLSAQINLSRFSEENFLPATEDEKRQQDVMSESTTFFKDGIRKLFKNPLAVASLIVLFCIILTIIIQRTAGQGRQESCTLYLQ